MLPNVGLKRPFQLLAGCRQFAILTSSPHFDQACKHGLPSMVPGGVHDSKAIESSEYLQELGGWPSTDAGRPRRIYVR